MKMKKIGFQTALGWFEIKGNEQGISSCLLQASIVESDEEVPSLLFEAKRQLLAYLQGQLQEFSLPLQAQGTPFQQKVWAALRTIPYGETRTYGEIAQQIGQPNAARAVGRANNKNPLLIFTPCHRVIGKNGAMVGFRTGLDTKIHLLQLEQQENHHV